MQTVSTRPGRRQARARRPRIEPLESRALLASIIDLAVSVQAAVPSVPVMGNETFMIKAKNLGPNTAVGMMRDILPLNTIFVTANPSGTYDSTTHTVNFSLMLQAGQEVGFAVVAKPMTGGKMTDRAVILPMASPGIPGPATDPDLSNNTDMATFKVEGGQDTGKADLAVSSSFIYPEKPHVGEESTLSYTVKNMGPDPASGVQLISSIPMGFAVDGVSSGSFSSQTNLVNIPVGSLAPGASEVFTVIGRPLSKGPMVIPAVVRSHQTDPMPMNNSAMIQTTVQPTPTVSDVSWTGAPFQPTHLYVQFSAEVNGALAGNLENYQLIDMGLYRDFGRHRPNAQGTFNPSTTQNRGRPVPLLQATYDPTRMQTIILPAQRLSRLHQYELIVNGRPPQGVANALGIPILGNISNTMGGIDVRQFGNWNSVGANQQNLPFDQYATLLGGQVQTGPTVIYSPYRPARQGKTIVHLPPAPQTRYVFNVATQTGRHHRGPLG